MTSIKQLIREIIPVIIGILIALFINNWNEDRKDQQYLTKISKSIEKELAESIADIEEVIPKQLASMDTIDNYLNNEAVSLFDVVVRANGIHAPDIKTNTWNAVANSKIELITYEKLSQLANIEEGKENLKMRSEKLIDFIFQYYNQTDSGKKSVLKFMILDVIGAEKELKLKIEEALENKAEPNDNNTKVKSN